MFAKIAIPVLFACSFGRIGAEVPEDQLRAALALLQHKEYLSANTNEYRRILTEILAKSGLSLKLNINADLQEKSLNFLLLSPDINTRLDVPIEFFSPVAQRLLHNCNYVGILNTIVCSQDFIDSFFDTYLRKESDVPYLPSKHKLRDDDLTLITGKRAFLFWVLGHEMGHLADGKADSHFGTALGLQDLTSPDELQQAAELRADAYCVKLLVQRVPSKHPTAYPKNIEQILITLANDEVITRHLTQGLGPGLLKYYSSSELITYQNAGDHPEYVIRAIRMLKILAELLHDAGLNAMTDSFIAHLKQPAAEPTKQ